MLGRGWLDPRLSVRPPSPAARKRQMLERLACAKSELETAEKEVEAKIGDGDAASALKAVEEHLEGLRRQVEKL